MADIQCPLALTCIRAVVFTRTLGQDVIPRPDLALSGRSPLVAGVVSDFVCSVCGQTYRSHRSLLSHMKLHQGLTVCYLCGKASNNRPDLRKHLVMKHGLTPEQVQEHVPDGRRRPT